MHPHNLKDSKMVRFCIVALSVCLALSGTFIVAYAANYIINTNESTPTVAEWANQSIPIFSSKPEDPTVDDNVDIENTYVARSITNTNAITPTINFMMSVYGMDPLSQAETAAVAYIDCPEDGWNTDNGFYPGDRMVVYILVGSSFIPSDAVMIATGDYSQAIYAGTSPETNQALGQVVGNSIEWATEIGNLRGTQDSVPGYCQDEVRIRFLTGNVELIALFPETVIEFTVIDEITEFRGLNIPTAIDVREFQASNSLSPMTWFIMVFGLFTIGGTGFLIFKRHRE